MTAEPALGSQLRSRGWPVITYDGQANAGAVQVQVIVGGRRRTALVDDLKNLAPRGYWTIEELRLSAEASTAAPAVIGR